MHHLIFLCNMSCKTLEFSQKTLLAFLPSIPLMLRICEVQRNLIRVQCPGSWLAVNTHQENAAPIKPKTFWEIGTITKSKVWYPMILSSNKRLCRSVACLAALECHWGSNQKVMLLGFPDATPCAKVTASSTARAPEQAHGATGPIDLNTPDFFLQDTLRENKKSI